MAQLEGNRPRIFRAGNYRRRSESRFSGNLRLANFVYFRPSPLRRCTGLRFVCGAVEPDDSSPALDMDIRNFYPGFSARSWHALAPPWQNTFRLAGSRDLRLHRRFPTRRQVVTHFLRHRGSRPQTNASSLWKIRFPWKGPTHPGTLEGRHLAPGVPPLFSLKF